MANWKNNKMVGISAGVVLVLSVILFVVGSIQKRNANQMSLEAKAQMEKVERQMQGVNK